MVVFVVSSVESNVKFLYQWHKIFLGTQQTPPYPSFFLREKKTEFDLQLFNTKEHRIFNDKVILRARYGGAHLEPNTWCTEANGSGVQGQTWLRSEFQASLGCRETFKKQVSSDFESYEK